MSKFYTILLLLFSGILAGHAQQQETSALVPATSERQNGSGAEVTSAQDALQIMAGENTQFFMKKYGITGKEKEKKIFEAFHKYLMATQGEKTGASDPEKPLELLKADLQQITGKELEPPIPN
jgi:hypothetical protein